MSQVAGALLACKLSSGGLECDFGLLKDVIKAKRVALGQGYVKVEMMLKLNKHLFLSSPQDIVKLADDKWQDRIPKRLADNVDSDEEDEENVETVNENLVILTHVTLATAYLHVVWLPLELLGCRIRKDFE
jgi:hypothetical protein